MIVEIVNKPNHYELYINGRFYASCDNYHEVQYELSKQTGSTYIYER